MKNILYLGLDPSRFAYPVTHYPIIEIREREGLATFFSALSRYDYLLFTSKVAVAIFEKHAGIKKPAIVIGEGTGERAERAGLSIAYLAKKECAEGVLEILKGVSGSFFFPHSSRARSLLLNYLKMREALAFPAYDTVPTKRRIDLSPFDHFVFTSPSTVDAFLELYGTLPRKGATAIGPITQKALTKRGIESHLLI